MNPNFIIFILSLSWSAVLLAWAVQIGYSTPTFRKLGIEDEYISYIWLAGPISGIVCQPIVGVLSDRIIVSSKGYSIINFLGPRYPFMIVGIVFICFSLIAFCSTPCIPSYGAVLAIISFWVLDFSINALQAPIRALVVDFFSTQPEMLTRANASLAISGCLGNSVAYFIGGGWLSQTDDSSLVGLYSFTTLYVIVCGFLPVILLGPCPVNCTNSSLNTNILTELKLGIKLMSPNIRRAFAVQFCTYCSLFVVFIYLTDWVASTSNDFNHGVEFANRSLFFMSISSAFIACVYTLVRTKFNRVDICLWFFSLVIFGLVLIVFAVSGTNTHIGIILFSFIFAFEKIIPWTIVSIELQKDLVLAEHTGKIVASFNLSQALPEILISLTSGGLIKLTSSIGSVFIYAGIFAIVASLLSISLWNF